MAKKFRVSPLEWHKVRAASTANVTIATLDAGQVLDGVTLVQGDAVLLKDQTVATENGMYLINADGQAATRHSEWAAGADRSGHAVRVYAGTANNKRVWMAYAEPGVVGTNAPVFIEHELT